MLWDQLKSKCAPNTTYVFSSPEPLGSQGKLIVYPLSRRPSVFVCHPPFSKIFSSETGYPIKAKFHVEPPWEGGTKVCINRPGHMTKMAATPIYEGCPNKSWTLLITHDCVSGIILKLL